MRIEKSKRKKNTDKQREIERGERYNKWGKNTCNQMPSLLY